MSAAVRRTTIIVIAVIGLALLAAVVWAVVGHEPGDEDADSPGTAVMPSDGGEKEPADAGGDPNEGEGSSATDDADQIEATGDYTDPEQVALAFATTYPGDIEDISDPTFHASLDGVDTSLVEEITDPRIEHVDQSTDDSYETHAFTIHGTYRGGDVQAYSIVVARPNLPEKDLDYNVHSFVWSPTMLGDEEDPGPAAELVAPITPAQRGDLLRTTRENVITQVLTVNPEESDQERQERLDALMVEPTDVKAPMSRSGRYGMKSEITSQFYTTEPGSGGPIQIGYHGTWVDPYDPTNTGSWALNVTITRDEDGQFVVQSVRETSKMKAT
ncbi:hypothetical protein BH708_02770 [Brachybacterium sp. P6-10-X1]|uniref:hypothetical protein n=1 Tax=Brachybacterium sp. P6-10-X1 TaxID=1903186 RepID=UPI000971ABB6|nr:hypothetical protein [Brachybacterium sp. P6-10-X1]APX31814.1 hypothetical protein BH708_02770 [Brachybacterium sp. P6-10-X1]